MGRSRRDRAAHARFACLLLAIAGVVGAALPPPAFGDGGLIGATYSLNFDEAGDRTEEKTARTRSTAQSVTLAYRGFLSPLIENEIAVKIEQETRTGELTKFRVSPIITLQTKGAYWSMGFKRMIDDSNEPGTNVKTTDSFFTELILVPPRRSLPDLRAKYTLDKDFEKDKTNTRKQSFTASSLYAPADWVSVRGEYTRNLNADLIKEDSDTEEEKITGTFGIRRLLSPKIKLDAEYKVETVRGATLLNAGGATGQREDQTHTVKSLLTYRPFGGTDLGASYDFTLAQNMVSGEHTLSRTGKVYGAQPIGSVLAIRGDFSRAESESRHTTDDFLKTEDTWNAEAAARISKFFDLNAKRQNKRVKEEQHADDTKNQSNTTISDTLTWNAALAAFWTASVSYARTVTYTFDLPSRSEKKSTVVSTYALRSPLDIKRVNLTIEPSYDITLTDDFAAKKEIETRDVRVRVAWIAVRTHSIEVKVDHSYDRKVDTDAGNISRTDTSTLGIGWTEPFPGWTLGIDGSRTATDISEDDLPPDISSSFGFRAEYKYDRFLFSTTERYDKKKLTDSSMNADAKVGWVAPRWSATLTTTYKRTLSVVLADGYTISFAFQYRL